MNRRYIVFAVLLLMLILFPFFTSDYLTGVVIRIFMFAALAMAWNIIGGFGGQLAFGNAAFFGVGAYTAAIGFSTYSINPWLGMLMGGLLAVLLSVLIGYPSFRLRGIYFSLSTFAFSLILEVLARHYISFTGGDMGINVPLLGHAPLQYQFDSSIPYYFIALVMVILYLLVCRTIQNSKFGYYLSALRNDQEAAEALGISSPQIKMYAFMISAFLSALVGTFYVQYTLFIDPQTAFGMHMSVEILLIAIAGGVGHLWGPVVGSFTLVSLGEITNYYFGADIPGIDLIVYAVVLIVIVKALPNGLVELLSKVSRINVSPKSKPTSK